MPHSPFGGLETLTVPKAVLPDKYYHVSPQAGITLLRPLSTQYSNDVNGKDTLALGTSIHGCIQALTLPNFLRNFEYGEDKDTMRHTRIAEQSKGVFKFHVYSVDTKAINKRFVYASEFERLHRSDVFDVMMTGQLTYTKELPCTYEGEIIVKMMTKDQYRRSAVGVLIPVLIYCTLPKATPFQVPVLDFTISPGPNTNITPDILSDDLDGYKIQLKQAFATYVEFIQKNAKAAQDAFTKASEKL